MKFVLTGLMVLTALISTGHASSMDKYKSEPGDAIYQGDINGDNKDEIIRVKDKFDTQSKTIIEVLKKNKIQVGSFSVPGRMEKIDFVELGMGGQRYISAHYRSRDDSETVAIYLFKDDKFRKIFSLDSNCGIETDYDSALARIKAGKFICNGDICSCTDIDGGQMWIWTGDKFLKER
jgi:hypothetical protein